MYFDQLVALFAEYDPCGLIDPEIENFDEYQSEAEILLGIVEVLGAPRFDLKKDNVEEIGAKILLVLNQMEIGKYAVANRINAMAQIIVRQEVS